MLGKVHTDFGNLKTLAMIAILKEHHSFQIASSVLSSFDTEEERTQKCAGFPIANQKFLEFPS